MSRFQGPIEDYPWPENLEAHVVTPGDEPRIHGYDVERDLARHYRLADLSLLTLVGELPTDEQALAFETAMAFLAPLSAAEAPTHATVLARICGSRPSGVIATAAIALAERARSIVDESARLLEWLAQPSAPIDPRFAAIDDHDREAVQRLQEALAARGVRIDALNQPLSRQAALLATLWFAGLTRKEQLETALLLASLPSVVAEAYHHGIASFREYPMQLPPFEYEES